MRPLPRTPPNRLTAVQNHSAASAVAAARPGVAIVAGNTAPRLPAKATASAPLPHIIDIQ
jgi:hypothetical protein